MNGILLINKPKGCTSFYVVDQIKNISGQKKVGHTGTLDPLASGVLPLCLGESTKASQFIMEGEKTYLVHARLGQRTDTFDAEGKVIEEGKRDPMDVTDKEIQKNLLKFTGNIVQLPPAFSAVKTHGKPLYEYARKGIEVERKPRSISIKNIEFISYKAPILEFKMQCSKGTYVRSVVDDLGVGLGTFAYVSDLCRLKTGSFDISECLSFSSIDEITKEVVACKLLTLEEVIKKMLVSIEVDEPLARKIAHGYQLSYGEFHGKLNILNELPQNKLIALFCNNSSGNLKLLCISELNLNDFSDLLSLTPETKILKTLRVFNADEWIKKK